MDKEDQVHRRRDPREAASCPHSIPYPKLPSHTVRIYELKCMNTRTLSTMRPLGNGGRSVNSERNVIPC